MANQWRVPVSLPSMQMSTCHQLAAQALPSMVTRYLGHSAKLLKDEIPLDLDFDDLNDFEDFLRGFMICLGDLK